MTFRDSDVSNNTSSHLSPGFHFRSWSVHGLSHTSLLTCFPESLLYCTLYCLSDKISLLNAASGGMKHISARRGSFLTTYYRQIGDRTIVSYLRYWFFFFFARFWFFTRFSFDFYPDVATLINLKDRAAGSFWFRLSFQIDLKGFWLNSFLF